MGIAHKDSWKTQPMPPATAVLDYRGRFSSEEFERMSHGLIPVEMEDKWFIYRDGTTLRLHRSWTGTCIYEVEFEELGAEHVVRRARVNRDKSQYGSTDDAYDSALLHCLISHLLLGKQVEFPVSGTLSPGPILQHISETYPERAVDSSTASGSASRKPWWKFW